MKYAIEIALNRIIPKEIKSIIATQRTLDILIDGVTENFVVIPMDEMLEVYKEQDFADLEVKRLCGVFGTPIPALPLERDKALDKVKEPPRTSRSLEREER